MSNAIEIASIYGEVRLSTKHLKSDIQKANQLINGLLAKDPIKLTINSRNLAQQVRNVIDTIDTSLDIKANVKTTNISSGSLVSKKDLARVSSDIRKALLNPLNEFRKIFYDAFKGAIHYFNRALYDGFKASIRGLTNLLTSMVNTVATTIKSVVGDSLSTFADLEASLNMVRSLSGEMANLGGVMQELETSVTKTAKDLPVTVGELGKAAVILKRAGLDVKDISSALPAVAQFAVGTGVTTDEAADIAAIAAGTIGKDIRNEDGSVNFAQVMEAVTQIANNSNQTVRDVANSLGYIGGTRGLQADDFATLSRALAESGIRGSSAGIASKELVNRLQRTQAQGTLQELGINVFDAQGQIRDLDNLMLELYDVASSLSDEDYSATLKKVVGERGNKALGALLNLERGELVRIIEESNQIEQQTLDTLENQAKINAQGLSGALMILQSTYDVALTDLGKGISGLGELVARSLTEMLNGFLGTNRDLATQLEALGNRIISQFANIEYVNGTRLITLTEQTKQRLSVIGEAIRNIVTKAVKFLGDAITYFNTGLLKTGSPFESFLNKSKEVLSTVRTIANVIWGTVERTARAIEFIKNGASQVTSSSVGQAVGSGIQTINQNVPGAEYIAPVLAATFLTPLGGLLASTVSSIGLLFSKIGVIIAPILPSLAGLKAAILGLGAAVITPLVASFKALGAGIIAVLSKGPIVGLAVAFQSLVPIATSILSALVTIPGAIAAIGSIGVLGASEGARNFAEDRLGKLLQSKEEIKKLNELSKRFVGNLVQGFNTLRSKIPDIVNWVKQIAANFKPVIDSLTKTGQYIGRTILVALATVADLLNSSYNYSKKWLNEAIIPIAKYIVEKVSTSQALRNIFATIESLTKSVLAVFKLILPLVSALLKFSNDIGSSWLITKTLTLAVKVAIELINGILVVLTGVIRGIALAVENILTTVGWIVEFFKEIVNQSRQFYGELLNSIKASDIIKNLTALILQLWNSVKQIGEAFKNVLVDIGSKVMVGIYQITGKLGEQWERLTDYLKGKGGFFDIISQSVMGMAQFVSLIQKAAGIGRSLSIGRGNDYQIGTSGAGDRTMGEQQAKDFYGIKTQKDLFLLIANALTEGSAKGYADGNYQSALDVAVSVANRLHYVDDDGQEWYRNYYGGTASDQISGGYDPNTGIQNRGWIEYEAFGEFGLHRVKDFETAVDVVAETLRVSEDVARQHVDAMMDQIYNYENVRDSIEHVQGSISYRANQGPTGNYRRAGDALRSSDDNYYALGNRDMALSSVEGQARTLARGLEVLGDAANFAGNSLTGAGETAEQAASRVSRQINPDGGAMASPIAGQDLDRVANWQAPHGRSFQAFRRQRRTPSYHVGVDFGTELNAGEGAAVQATVDGVVSKIARIAANDRTGEDSMQIFIESVDDLGNKIEQRYNHLAASSINLEVGDEVRAGEQIALVGGDDSVSQGAHLDYKVRVNGEFVNPQEFLALAGAAGTLTTKDLMSGAEGTTSIGTITPNSSPSQTSDGFDFNSFDFLSMFEPDPEILALQAQMESSRQDLGLDASPLEIAQPLQVALPTDETLPVEEQEPDKRPNNFGLNVGGLPVSGPAFEGMDTTDRQDVSALSRKADPANDLSTIVSQEARQELEELEQKRNELLADQIEALQQEQQLQEASLATARQEALALSQDDGEVNRDFDEQVRELKEDYLNQTNQLRTDAISDIKGIYSDVDLLDSETVERLDKILTQSAEELRVSSELMSEERRQATLQRVGELRDRFEIDGDSTDIQQAQQATDQYLSTLTELGVELSNSTNAFQAQLAAIENINEVVAANQQTVADLRELKVIDTSLTAEQTAAIDANIASIEQETLSLQMNREALAANQAQTIQADLQREQFDRRDALQDVQTSVVDQNASQLEAFGLSHSADRMRAENEQRVLRNQLERELFEIDQQIRQAELNSEFAQTEEGQTEADQEVAHLQQLKESKQQFFDNAIQASENSANLAIQFWQEVSQGVVGTVTDGITSILDGTKTVKEAFGDMLKSIAQMIIKAGVQKLMSSLLGGLFGGGFNQGGGVGGALGFAEGGEVPLWARTGNKNSRVPRLAGSTVTKDSLLSMLTPGEFVLSRNDVRNLGGFRGVEALRSQASRMNTIPGFNTGGAVSGYGNIGALQTQRYGGNQSKVQVEFMRAGNMDLVTVEQVKDLANELRGNIDSKVNDSVSNFADSMRYSTSVRGSLGLA